MSTDTSLPYYSQNAERFAAETRSVDFSDTRERFLALLPPGAAILDFGCGSGRDSKAFLERGFSITAADGSPELCALASAYAGIPVRTMLFEELDVREEFDGIWACASILHVPSAELPGIFCRMINALRPGGIIYTSFKYGTFEGERSGRRFTDFTEETFRSFLIRFPALIPEALWISGDVRPGREKERWLNALLRLERQGAGEKA